ncbi:recombinase RecT [uncultured Paraglaciecola sp.]|uniref:recombinase RecT n=1 Tax=uncultured Paraglaciecola sp. TaxID=1765024 RepID=UPI00260846C6|nr:recombinase RecT [uncultured Paraglaciecola sp.]
MTNKTAVAKQPRSQKLVEMFDEQKDKIASTLMPGIDPNKFIQIVKNAVLQNPDIAEASHTSVFLECQKAAADGLVIDGREAALVVYNQSYKVGNEWKKKKVCTYIPMVAGVIKRVRSSGQIRAWQVGAVYAAEIDQDRFDYHAGDNPSIRHHPVIFGDRGDIVAFYSSVKLADGTMHHELMTREEVDGIMRRSKTYDKQKNIAKGPWATDYAEMGKKTVIKRHSKRLPIDADLGHVLERENVLYDFEQTKDGSFEEVPEPPKHIAPRKKKSAAKKLKEAETPPEEEIEEAEIIEDDDVIDGEIIEDDGDQINPDDEF